MKKKILIVLIMLFGAAPLLDARGGHGGGHGGGHRGGMHRGGGARRGGGAHRAAARRGGTRSARSGRGSRGSAARGRGSAAHRNAAGRRGGRGGHGRGHGNRHSRHNNGRGRGAYAGGGWGGWGWGWGFWGLWAGVGILSALAIADYYGGYYPYYGYGTGFGEELVPLANAGDWSGIEDRLMARLDDLEDQLQEGQANNSLNAAQIQDLKTQIQRIQIHLDGIPQGGMSAAPAA